MKPFLAAALSLFLATIAVAALASLAISAPRGCGADFGFIILLVVPLYLFSVSIFAGLASLVWLPIAALPGWLWGKRAVTIELVAALFAIVVLVLYQLLVPHPGDGTQHCGIIDRMF